MRQVSVDSIDHNPRTLRSLPLGFYHPRARRRNYRLLWIAGAVLILLAAAFEALGGRLP